MYEILITNDDGIQSPALAALERALAALGNITVVVPDREMSGTSHSITLNNPLRYHQVSPNHWAVRGTPADCVILAALRILKEPPALVISGVNRGVNIGDDIPYSGTVAAATEAALQGIPAIAVSMKAIEDCDFAPPSQAAARIAAQVLETGLPPDVILNVNHPAIWNGGFRLTRQGRRAGRAVLVDDVWLHEELHHEQERLERNGPLTDYEALAAGYVSICPLQINRTAHVYLNHFSRWTEKLQAESQPKSF